MKNRFYLACFRDNVGSNVSFQRHEFRGYHTDIDQAHVCTLEEAQYHFDHAREYDCPISADHVDELAIWKVDHQYIPNQTQIIDGVIGYAVFVKKQFDGNDVFWLNKRSFETSTDFESASYFSLEEISELGQRYIAIPYHLADKAKRRTFDFNKYNPRTMTQGAGLKMPEHLKKAKRRVKEPQSRFNCPSCGKIVWQYNPYDFESCSHCGQIGDQV
ncbi:hypothetical protein I5523_08355 [Acinetobacter oleivorans]|uniref:hypothetical protein n=1 Tax=Acinetobacter oleivorans TaxID=1148157 RepID=UPI001901F504|nr:hypothetical protein [Acinetobacter oleivorans]MBJ9739653.1 hypothetical protein [Acinetobacter oleivorans]